MTERTMTERSGGCLCGAVRFRAARADSHVHACHCATCTGWGEGVAFAVDVGTEVAFEGAAHIATYRSSDWAERGFCARCGTHLFFRLVDTGAMNVNAGVFDNQTGFTLTEQIFIDEKAGWFDLANDTPRKTGAEVFAAFAQQGDTP